MGLAIPSFVQRLLSPPGAGPLRREPNRRWARGAARPQLLRLRVAEVVVETPSTRTLVFDDGALDYRAGQHLTLVVDIDGHTHRRCYSFSSAPSAETRPQVTVKRVAGGVVSNWLHDNVREGDVLRAMPASGRFTLEAACGPIMEQPASGRVMVEAANGGVSLDGAPRHLAMVAGGVGITPILSMAEDVLRGEDAARVTLLYGNRCEDDIVFRSRLEAMQRLWPGRFDVVFALDDAPENWKGLVGPLAGERVVAATAGSNVDAWFVCGPEPMMDSVVAALEASHVEAGRIHVERFRYAEPSAAALPTKAGSVVFSATGVTAAAAVGVTILEAAEAAGVVLPSSCRMGGCGACKVKVDGRVVAAEPNCLTEQEKADGYALACCSYADGRVVLPEF